MRRLWITGYRSYELNVFKDDDPKVAVIKSVIQQELRQRLAEADDEFWLITGPQLGVEQWALEVGLELQTEFKQLKLSMMLPFTEFGQQWNENNQAKLANLRERVDFAASTSDHPYQSPQQLRAYQHFMLTHTDSCLMVYDPEHAGKPKYDYAAAKKFSAEGQYQVRLLDFDELQEAANEWEEREREKKLSEQGY